MIPNKIPNLGGFAGNFAKAGGSVLHDVAKGDIGHLAGNAAKIGLSPLNMIVKTFPNPEAVVGKLANIINELFETLNKIIAKVVDLKGLPIFSKILGDLDLKGLLDELVNQFFSHFPNKKQLVEGALNVFRIVSDVFPVEALIPGGKLMKTIGTEGGSLGISCLLCVCLCVTPLIINALISKIQKELGYFAHDINDVAIAFKDAIPVQFLDEVLEPVNSFIKHRLFIDLKKKAMKMKKKREHREELKKQKAENHKRVATETEEQGVEPSEDPFLSAEEQTHDEETSEEDQIELEDVEIQRMKSNGQENEPMISTESDDEEEEKANLLGGGERNGDEEAIIEGGVKHKQEDDEEASKMSIFELIFEFLKDIPEMFTEKIKQLQEMSQDLFSINKFRDRITKGELFTDEISIFLNLFHEITSQFREVVMDQFIGSVLHPMVAGMQVLSNFFTKCTREIFESFSNILEKCADFFDNAAERMDHIFSIPEIVKCFVNPPEILEKMKSTILHIKKMFDFRKILTVWKFLEKLFFDLIYPNLAQISKIFEASTKKISQVCTEFSKQDKEFAKAEKLLKVFENNILKIAKMFDVLGKTALTTTFGVAKIGVKGLGDAKDTANLLAQGGLKGLQNATDAMQDVTNEQIENAVALTKDLANAGKKAISDVGNLANSTIGKGIETTGEIANAGIQKINDAGSLVQNLGENAFAKGIDTANAGIHKIDDAGSLVQSLGENTFAKGLETAAQMANSGIDTANAGIQKINDAGYLVQNLGENAFAKGIDTANAGIHAINTAGSLVQTFGENTVGKGVETATKVLGNVGKVADFGKNLGGKMVGGAFGKVGGLFKK